jgi:hypothetical protein
MLNASAGGPVARSEILAWVLCAIAAPWTAQARAPVAPAPRAQPEQRPDEHSSAVAWTPPPNEGDVALLRGLLYAFEPAPREIRIIATEDLALLGDPRALDALARIVFDPDPAVAEAAVHAVIRFQHPRAEEMLADIIRHPALPDALKLIAVEGLPFQGSSRSRELLAEIASSPLLSAVVRNAAQRTLARMTTADPVTTR